MRHLSRGRFAARPGARGRGTGFTILELLVAFAVGAMLLVSLASIVSGALSVSRKSNNALLAGNDAASALDMIGADLECLVAGGGGEFLHVGSETVGDATNVSRLMFLSATSNETNDPGQVRGVMYRLGYQDVLKSGGPDAVYGIYRVCETNAGVVFTNYLGQSNLSQAAGFQSATNSLNDFLVGNVVDLRVRFYPAGSLVPINPDAADAVRMSGGTVTVGTSAATNGVATAEVSLTVLEEAGAQLLRNGVPLETVRQKYGHVLARKIPLRAP